jgi:hypothetical protein
MSNTIEKADNNDTRPSLSLTTKARNRIKKKALVSLREQDVEKQSQ